LPTVLKALLAGKLDGEMTRSPQTVEDLVTSVVLGACSYLPPRAALLPFLSEARTDDGQRLRDHLRDVERATLTFWPEWQAFTHADGTTEGDVAGGEPDAIVEFLHVDGRRSMLVVEAKVLSGKSSRPSNGPTVTDQLGKYWVHLLALARGASATPLGIVHLTSSVTLPSQEFTETLTELRAKGVADAPLYWLSWRHFAECVPGATDPLLLDVVTLLRDRWMLVQTRMGTWPTTVSRSEPWRFTPSWRWGSYRAAADWTFEEESP